MGHSKKEKKKKYSLPHWERALSTTQVVGGNGWKNPAIVASLLWNTWFRCILTSQSAQKNGCGRQSRQRTAAGLLPHCWQIWVVAFCCATMVFTRQGLSFSHLSERRLFRVDQSEEARGGAGAVSWSSKSSPCEWFSSSRKVSVKIVHRI